MLISYIIVRGGLGDSPPWGDPGAFHWPEPNYMAYASKES